MPPHGLEDRGWRMEVGGWKLEVGSWKLEVGRRDAETYVLLLSINNQKKQDYCNVIIIF